jgi:hypothetical protein
MAQPLVVSHWYKLIDGLQLSTEEFCKMLQCEVESWDIPRAKIDEVEHSEAGTVLGAKRLYLRVYRDGYIFDVCFSQFGRGCFVSWWLVTNSGCFGLLAEIPFLGLPFRFFVKKLTYYRIDAAIAFQEVVHACVLKMVDDLIEVNSLQSLTIEQRKPIMSEFFKR